MDYKQVFISLVVVFVAAFAIFGFVGSLNKGYSYAGADLDTEFYATFGVMNKTLETLATDVGQNTRNDAGATLEAPSEGIISKAWSTFQQLPTLLSLVPALLSDAARLLEIPSVYVSAAQWIFIFAFSLTMAYLLLLGVQRLL